MTHEEKVLLEFGARAFGLLCTYHVFSTEEERKLFNLAEKLDEVFWESDQKLIE